MKSHLIGAMLALCLGAAGCTGVGQTTQRVWVAWEEQSPASLREYQSFLDGLRQFEGQRLWDSSPTRQLALLAQIDRVRQRDLPPACLSEVTSSSGVRYKLLVEAWPLCESVPSAPRVRATILYPCYPACIVQEFSPGWRTTVSNVSITNVPALPGDILQLECGSQYLGDDSRFTLWYSVLEPDPSESGLAPAPELVLIRVQAGDGKPALWVFGSYGRDGEGAPIPSFACAWDLGIPSPECWERLLRSSNDVQVLSALLFIGSEHRRADFGKTKINGQDAWRKGSAIDPQMEKLRANVLSSKVCKELAGHRNPWIRELAGLLLSGVAPDAGDRSREPTR